LLANWGGGKKETKRGAGGPYCAPLTRKKAEKGGGREGKTEQRPSLLS